MSNPWPIVRLGGVLKRATETVTLQADAEYREITVKLWGRGAVLRGITTGARIAGARRFVAKAGQLILSRIDARNGATGIVPDDLDGAVVTNDFPLFDLDVRRIEPAFLGWLTRTGGFVDLCKIASEGTTNRVRLKEGRFLALEVPLPPLAEQRRLAARVEEVATRLATISRLRDNEEQEIRQLLHGAFQRVVRSAPRRPLCVVAPLVRRPVDVDPSGVYMELGIRSHGKGTFHKPALTGIEVGGKRIFHIEPGDLLFSNVFAWEGAIAVARVEDVNRVGSHRYITCVPTPGVATADFLRFFFLGNDGLDMIQAASPGGAGRNRTLGLSALRNIEVPVPSIAEQHWFDDLHSDVVALRRLQAETAAELDAMLPAVLDRAFRGEL